MLPRSLPLRRASRALLVQTRTFTLTTIRPMDPKNDRNNPPSRQGGAPPDTDAQSSASQEEHKSGDDHPAKQPDAQAEPERTTGFGGETKVEGGKEGVGERTDKQ